MLFCKFNSLIPLIQQNTAIYCFFNISTFNKALYSQLRDTKWNKFLSKFF